MKETPPGPPPRLQALGSSPDKKEILILAVVFSRRKKKDDLTRKFNLLLTSPLKKLKTYETALKPEKLGPGLPQVIPKVPS